MELHNICWNITNKCNERCIFCFRDTRSVDLPFKDNLTILNKLSEFGVRKLTFAGGEPTLYKGIFDLVRQAKKNNIITSLTTNGITLNDEILRSMRGHLDWITLPLDGSTSEMQEKMTRNKDHFNNIISLLEYISMSECNLNLKVNTLVTKINYEDIDNIRKLLETYRIKRWKMFQFIPIRDAAKQNQERFILDDKKFIELKNAINTSDYGNNMTISLENVNKLTKSYFVIFPDGSVKISDGNSGVEITAGNMLTDDIYNIWNLPHYDHQIYNSRVELLREICF